jgi:hypothetical protein
MTNPMSNVVFDMAAATLSNGNLRGVISNAPAPSSQVLEISLKPRTKNQVAVIAVPIADSLEFGHKPSLHRHGISTRSFFAIS